MENFRAYAPKIAIGLLVIFLAAASVGDFIFYQKLNQLQTEGQKKSDQITTLNVKLSNAAKIEDTLKTKFNTAQVQCKFDTDTLNEKIEAFSKQAAACNAIKQKLHLN